MNLVVESHELPDADHGVAVAGVQGSTVSRPRDAVALGLASVVWGIFFLVDRQFGDALLGFQIPDADITIIGGSAQPVSVGGEAEVVDRRLGVQMGQSLAFIQVPKEGLTRLITRSTQGAIRTDGHGVNVGLVSLQVELQFLGRQFNDLHALVPSGGNDDRFVVAAGRKSHARDPVAVGSVILIVRAPFFDSNGIPQLDSIIPGSRDNLAVVRGESNTENVLLMSSELLGCLTGFKVPQPQGAIPRGGKRILTIRGKVQVFDNMVVANESTSDFTIHSLLVIDRKAPYANGLVSGSAKKLVGVFKRRFQARNGIRVSSEVAHNSH